MYFPLIQSTAIHFILGLFSYLFFKHRILEWRCRSVIWSSSYYLLCLPFITGNSAFFVFAGGWLIGFQRDNALPLLSANQGDLNKPVTPQPTCGVIVRSPEAKESGLGKCREIQNGVLCASWVTGSRPLDWGGSQIGVPHPVIHNLCEFIILRGKLLFSPIGLSRHNIPS